VEKGETLADSNTGKKNENLPPGKKAAKKDPPTDDKAIRRTLFYK